MLEEDSGITILGKLGLLILFGLMLYALFPSTGHAEGTTKPINITAVKPIDPPLILDVPNTFIGDDNAVWDVYIGGLRKTSATNIIFRVQGYGGSVMEANGFIQAVNDATAAGKDITMDVIGPAYSAHAFIVCAGKHVILREGSTLMFHAASFVRSYLFGMVEYMDSSKDPATEALQNRILNQCIKNGILTVLDVKYILADGDVNLSMVNNKLLKTYNVDVDRTTKLWSDLAMLVFLLSIILIFIGLAKRI